MRRRWICSPTRGGADAAEGALTAVEGAVRRVVELAIWFSIA
jgi:hypothetical protein